MVCPTSTVSSIFVVSNTNITSISDDLRRGKEGISEKDDDKGKAWRAVLLLAAALVSWPQARAQCDYTSHIKLCCDQLS